MGKYDHMRNDLPDGVEYTPYNIQLAIANELAEANRLKRLEIQLQTSLNRESLGKETTYFRNNSELDQA